MIVDIHNVNGSKTGRTVELPDTIFGIEPNEHTVYLAVKQYLAHQRQGTHKSKERSELSGSTRKLFKQKGTGGARRGDINSPLLYGGARVFGPKPHDYVIKLNKKVKVLARKSALSAKAKEGAIIVVEDFTLEAPKTKIFAGLMKGLGVHNQKATVVTSGSDEILFKSSRNLPNVQTTRASDLNTYQIVNAGKLIISENSIEKIKEILA